MYRLNYLIAIIVTLVITSSLAFGSAPSTQARSISFSNVGSDAMRISWIHGNGGNRIVVISTDENDITSISSSTLNGNEYADGNGAYTSGDNIVGNAYVVYDGSGRNRAVNVTGLTASTVYYAKVFEYRHYRGDTYYNVDDASNNPRSRSTGIGEVSVASITFTTVGSSDATVTWTTPNENYNYIIDLYNNTLDEYHPDFESADIGQASSFTNTTSRSYALDFLDMSTNYGFRIKNSFDGSESNWSPNDFTTRSFTTTTDNTDPEFTVTIYPVDEYGTEASTLTPGQYYVILSASEELDSNPALYIDVNTSGTARTYTDHDMDIAQASTQAWSSTTFVYEWTIPTAGYDPTGHINNISPTFSLDAEDYGGNQGTFTATWPSNTYLVDNRPPSISSVTISSGTFGVGDIVTATITTDENAAVRNILRLNSNTTSEFAKFIGSAYTATWTVGEGDTSVDDFSNLSMSFSLNDQPGNSSTYFNNMGSYLAEPSPGGSTFYLDASSPTITDVYLISASYNVGQDVELTFEAIGSDIYSELIDGQFNGQTLTNITYTGVNGSSRSYTTTYTVVEGNNDIMNVDELDFYIAINDGVGNTSSTYGSDYSNSITRVGSTSFQIDANSPVISQIDLPDDVFGIGEIVSATITVAEPDFNNIDYSLNSGSYTINNVEIDGPQVDRIGSSSYYTASYTVVEGNNDQINVEHENLSVSFSIVDAFGNTSNTIETAAATSSITIDATRPILSSVTFSSNTFGIGDAISVTFTSTEPHHTNISATINGQVATDFVNNGVDNEYTMTYTVVEGDTDHTNANSVDVDLILIDRASNTTGISNTTGLADANFYIDANSPVLSSITFTSDTYTIGEIITGTFTSEEYLTFDANGASLFNDSGVYNDDTAYRSNINYLGGAGNSTSYSFTYTITEGDDDITPTDINLTVLGVTDGPNSITFNYIDGGSNTFDYGNGIWINSSTPVLSSVLVEDGNHKVGDDVLVYFVTDSDSFGDYQLTSLTFNDEVSANWDRVGTVNGTSTYTSTYTVEDGNTDILNAGSINYSISFTDYSGNATFTDQNDVVPVAVNSDVTIDANVPQVTAVTLGASMANQYGIGDQIQVTLEANASQPNIGTLGTNYTSPTFTINGQNVTEFTKFGASTSYTGLYTVVEDDPSHTDISSLEVSVKIQDPSGNTSTFFNDNNTAITPGTGSDFVIDAGSASINALSLPAGTFLVGQSITATFTADENNYLNTAHTFTINSKSIATASFTNIGSGSYTAVFSVEEGDNDVNGIEELDFTLETSDTFGNNSIQYVDGASTNSNSIQAQVIGNGDFFIVDANSPTITAVQFTSNTYKIGDTVTATISVANDETGLLLYNASSSFNGTTFTNFTENTGTYTIDYIVVEGDGDVAQLPALTSTSVTLRDSFGNTSNVIESASITQTNVSGSFVIDATRPIINAIAFESGTFGIDDNFTATLSTDELLGDIERISINSQTISSFTHIGSGSYTMLVPVESGDTEVSNAQDVTVSISIFDNAGNTNSPTFTSNPDNNSDFIIDSSIPVVSEVVLPSNTFKVGDIVTATITADQNNYDSATLTINDKVINEIFATSMGSLSYTASFTVEEDDNDVVSINSLSYGLVIASSTFDQISMHSISYTEAVLSPKTEDGDAFYIDANSPSITLATIEDGNYKVGDVVTVTFTVEIDEANLALVNNSSSFNGTTYSSDITFDTDHYTINYSVAEGDNDVENLAGLTSSSITIVDLAGNVSNTQIVFTASTFSIDANTATITELAIEPGIYGITENITATITSDEADLLRSSIEINGQTISTSITETSPGSISYTFEFPVSEGDDEHASASSLTFAMALVDPNGNITTVVTESDFLATNDSQFIVDASAATITGVTYASGSYGIGDDVSLTFEMDQNNYDISSATINGQVATDYGQIGGSNSYSLTYTVVESDEDADSVNDIEIIAWTKSSTFSQAEMNSITYSAGNEFDYYAASSATIWIDANRPYVDEFIYPAGDFGISETVTATFTVRNSEDDSYENITSISSASINNIDVQNLTNIGTGTYTIDYVVSEGDTDRDNLAAIPTSLIVTDNFSNSSTVSFTPSSTGPITIDGNKPVITAAYLQSSTDENINDHWIISDQIQVQVIADETGYETQNNSFTNFGTAGTFTVNGQPVTSFSDDGGGSYLATYTVVEGDEDADQASDVELVVTLVDAAGNESDSFTAFSNTATMKIDANLPTAENYYYLNPDFNIPISDLTSPYIPLVLTVPDQFTLAVFVDEPVLYNLSSPSANANQLPRIELDAQGDNNDISETTLTHKNSTASGSTFYIQRDAIVDDEGTDGTVQESTTFQMVDLAGNSATFFPTNWADFNAYVDATPPSFTYTYYEDAAYTTLIPSGSRLKPDTYYVKLEASEAVLETATFTITTEASTYNIEQNYAGAGNTTTFGYTRVIHSDSELQAGDPDDNRMTSTDTDGNVLSSGTFANADTYLIYTDTKRPDVDLIRLTFENEEDDIVNIDNNSMTVSVIYDEEMDTGTRPTVTFTGNPQMDETSVIGWSTYDDGEGTTITNAMWEAVYTHDLTQENHNSVTATVADASGAQDLAGNDEEGGNSSSFIIDTERANAVLLAEADPIYESDLIQYVYITYDEDMDQTSTPSVTFSSESDFSLTDSDWLDSRTWSATYTHSGEEETNLAESSTVSANAGSALDARGNYANGAESNTFNVDTDKPSHVVFTSNINPITQDNLTQSVTITFDEAMNTAYNPILSINTSNSFANASSTAWNSNTEFYAEFVHNGQEEEIDHDYFDMAAENARDIYGNITKSATSTTFQIDTDYPGYALTYFSNTLINTKNSSTTFFVVFDEEMNQGNDMSYNPGSSVNITDNDNGWLNSTTYFWELEHNLNEETDLSSTVSFADGETDDLVGNYAPELISPTFTIDTDKPDYTLDLMSSTINIANTTLYVTANFDELMNIGTTPSITFNSLGNLTTGSGVWIDNYNYMFTVNHDSDLESRNTATFGIDNTSGAEDLRANFVNPETATITVDTENPSGTVTVSTNPINFNNLATTVTVVYNEDMITSYDPSVTFSQDSGSFTAGVSNWLGSNTYYASYTWSGITLADITVGTQDNGGAIDLVGNPELGGSATFRVDTKPPSATLTITNNGTERNIARDGVTMIVTADFDEPIADAPSMQIEIDLPGTNVAAANMTKVTNTRYTYDWIVGNGGSAGDGEATFSLVNGEDENFNGVEDGNLTYGNTGASIFTVDNTAPQLNGFEFTSVDNESGTISFDEPVYTSLTDNYGTGDLAWVNDFQNPNRLPDAGSAVVLYINPLNHTAGSTTMSFGAGISGDAGGTERYVLSGKDNQIYDLAGNAYLSSSTVSATLNRQNRITDFVFTTPDGFYNEDDANVAFDLVFESDVTVDDAGVQLPLSTGTATYSSVNANTITFEYDIQDGDNSADLTTDNSASFTVSDVFIDENGFVSKQILPSASSIAANHAIVIDTEEPVITIGDPDVTLINNSGTVAIIVTFTGADNALLASVDDGPGNVDITTNGSITSFDESFDTDYPNSATYYIYNVTGNGTFTDLEISGQIIGDVITDNAGNVAETVNKSISIEVDNTDPTITISSSADDPTNESPFSLTFTVNEDNTFELADISLVNATVNNFVDQGGFIYTADITPTTDGDVDIFVSNNEFTDIAGNDNVFSNTFETTYDETSPSATIVLVQSPTSIDNNTLEYYIEFDEDMNQADKPNIVQYYGSSREYDFDATSGSWDNARTFSYTENNWQPSDNNTELNDNVIIGLSESVEDLAGNLVNTITSSEGSNTFDYDIQRPNATFAIDAPLVGTDLNKSTTLTISEDHINLSNSDFVINNASASISQTFSTNVYEVEINADATYSGPIELKLNAGSFADGAGNTNLASNAVTYTIDDGAPDIVSLDIYSNNANSSEWASPGQIVTITFTANEAINSSTVTITNRNANNIINSYTDDNENFTATYTVNGTDDVEGDVEFTIEVEDAGNLTASTSHTFSSSTVTLDITEPSLTYTISSETMNYNNNSVTVTMTSDDMLNSVNGFAASGTNGIQFISSSSINNYNYAWVFTHDQSSFDGIGTINITGGTAENIAGGTASVIFSDNIVIDTDYPEASTFTPIENNSYDPSVSFTIIWDQDLDGELELGDITIDADGTDVNGALDVTLNTVVSEKEYVLELSNMSASGAISATINANTVVDPNGNNNQDIAISTLTYMFMEPFTTVDISKDEVSSTISAGESFKALEIEFEDDAANIYDDFRATIIDKIIVERPTSDIGEYNYDDIFVDAYLTNQNASSTYNSTVSFGASTFSIDLNPSRTISDNETRTFSLYINASETFNSTVDNIDFNFDISGGNITYSGNSTRVEQVTESSTTVGASTSFNIVANEIEFSEAPTLNENKELNAKTNVSVKAVDSFGNIDIDFNGAITLKSSVTFTNSDDEITATEVSSTYVNANSGTLTYDVYYKVTQESATIATTNTFGLSNVISPLFNVIPAAPDFSITGTKVNSAVKISFDYSDELPIFLVTRKNNATSPPDPTGDESADTSYVYSAAGNYSTNWKKLAYGPGQADFGDYNSHILNLASGGRGTYYFHVWKFGGTSSNPIYSGRSSDDRYLRKLVFIPDDRDVQYNSNNEDFLLSNVYPNPIVDEVNFNINVIYESHFNIGVYDNAGNRLETIEDNLRLPIGKHKITFELSSGLASGRYILLVTNADNVADAIPIVIQK